MIRFDLTLNFYCHKNKKVNPKPTNINSVFSDFLTNHYNIRFSIVRLLQNFMLNLFHKIKTRVKTNAKNTVVFLRYYFSKYAPTESRNKRQVYIDINNPRLERYYYLLLKFFDLADCQINIKFSLWLLLNLRNYSDLIYHLNNLKFVSAPPEHYDLWLTQNPKAASGEKVLLVDVNYFSRQKKADEYIFPYNMHPEVYHSGLYKSIPQLRETRKSIRVFFGGNTGSGYGNPDIPELFGKITRNEIVARLEAFPSREKLTEITNDQQMSLLSPEKTLPLVIAKKPLFTPQNWLKILAQSDFYIAAPGFSMPFSHNAVEAMSVGAIPILQYSEMFEPPLTDMVDCLTFDGESELVEKINLALDMSAEQIRLLRVNVLNYYDQNLDPARAVDNLFRNLPSVKKMYLNAEHISLMELKKELARKLETKSDLQETI